MPSSYPSLASAALLAAGILAVPSRAATAVALEENGPAQNRICMVYVAEGFTTAQMADFASSVDKAVRYRDTAAMAEPYRRYRKFFNSYRIDLPSAVSGITHPGEADKNTALGGHADNDRLGTVDGTKLIAAVKAGMAAVPAKKTWHYAVLNDPGYFNSGGQNACVFSKNYWGEIALHEGGHAFHAFADEYGGTGTYSGGEPREINVTADKAGSKWARWMGYRQPVVGVTTSFEGGRYFDHGVFRPSQNSKMNLTSQTRPAPFNIVSVEKIIQDIYAVVRPIDSFRDTSAILSDPDSLWVRSVDPSVLKVEWSVDGKVVPAYARETAPLWAFPGLTLGSHVIKARVYDEIVLHANSDNANPHPLDLVRTGLASMEQSVSWRVRVTRGVALAPRPRSLPRSQAWAGESEATMALFGCGPQCSAPSWSVRADGRRAIPLP